MPQLAEGLRIYAIGDVHGRADLLERLFALIDDDLQQRPTRAIHVMLGDYVDRGPASRAVIDLILTRAAGMNSLRSREITTLVCFRLWTTRRRRAIGS